MGERISQLLAHGQSLLVQEKEMSLSVRLLYLQSSFEVTKGQSNTGKYQNKKYKIIVVQTGHTFKYQLRNEKYSGPVMLTL